MPHIEDPILFAKPYAGSLALLSKAPVQKRTNALVFVHGLFGGPISTWTQFHSIVNKTEIATDFWQHSDLYFYRYESFGHSVSELSERFRNFLDLIVPVPKESAFETEIL